MRFIGDKIQNGGRVPKSCGNIENINGFGKNTAGLRRGKSLDLDSAWSKVVCYVKIFQFHDMLNESKRYRATANGLVSTNIKVIRGNIFLENTPLLV